jgi:hypothetical protein
MTISVELHAASHRDDDAPADVPANPRLDPCRGLPSTH